MSRLLIPTTPFKYLTKRRRLFVMKRHSLHGDTQVAPPLNIDDRAHVMK